MPRQPWRDTPQQKAILRQNKVARRVRRDYPYGRRVTTGKADGTVYRHVPHTNAQGGVVVVDWDNGVRGRVSPINLRPLARREPGEVTVGDWAHMRSGGFHLVVADEPEVDRWQPVRAACGRRFERSRVWHDPEAPYLPRCKSCERAS